jgi:hypothetical protein
MLGLMTTLFNSFASVVCLAIAVSVQSILFFKNAGGNGTGMLIWNQKVGDMEVSIFIDV